MTVGRRNGHVELVVEDDGRGFSPEELERPGDRSRFGLRALDDLVHDRGGELHVTSTPSQGTRLAVEVPVA
jgi:signal transduction histidine kinase